MSRKLRPVLTLLALAAAWTASAPTPAQAAEPFTLEADVGYPPNGPLNRFDVYEPVEPAAKKAPIVVYVHGGGWRTGDKDNRIIDKARLFTGAGYVFVSVNYRLSPDPPEIGNPGRIRFPVHPDDVASAVSEIQERAGSFGGDPGRIVLIGHSAGAHLVSLLGARASFLEDHGVDPLAIRGVVPLDTEAYDVAAQADPAVSTLRPAALQVFWNAFATPAENAADDTWAEASPLGHGDRRDPPMLFITQAARADRIAISRAMAADLGLEPNLSVVAVPLNHEGINQALGSPDDTTVETETVARFVRDAFAVDGAPPTKLLSKPPRKLEASGRRTRVRVGFRAADVRARYRCRMDSRAWKDCTSPAEYRLKRGKHTFRVRSETRDGLGPIRRLSFRIVGR